MPVQLAARPNPCRDIRLQSGKEDAYLGGKAQHVEYLLKRAYLQDIKRFGKEDAYQLESDGRVCAQPIAQSRADHAPMHCLNVLAHSALGRKLSTFVSEFGICARWLAYQRPDAP